MVGLTHERIDADAMVRALAWEGAGAVLVFSGVAREDRIVGEDGIARTVESLVYECYEAMAIPVLETVHAEVVAAHPGARVAMVHRLGPVPIGEASVVVAVAAPHRDEAYQASRMAIDELKKRVPIWKKEIFPDGEAWKANAPKSGR